MNDLVPGGVHFGLRIVSTLGKNTPSSIRSLMNRHSILLRIGLPQFTSEFKMEYKPYVFAQTPEGWAEMDHLFAVNAGRVCVFRNTPDLVYDFSDGTLKWGFRCHFVDRAQLPRNASSSAGW